MLLMKKLSLLGLFLFISTFSHAQTGLTLNLLCQISGEITGISSGPNPLTKIPISGSMSILVENGFIISSDTNNYFSEKMPAMIEPDRIFGFNQWKEGDAENKLSIEVNRNSGMLSVSKEKFFRQSSILLNAKASGTCEKLANRRKF
jgi:hypothetical protein